ncbi:MAG: choice-of-anchor D domain-containing protein [Pseudomonadota bacterium]
MPDRALHPLPQEASCIRARSRSSWPPPPSAAPSTTSTGRTPATTRTRWTPATPPDPQAPDIDVEPASLDFGYIMQECPSAAQEVTITNKGGATLMVDSIELSGDGRSSFSLTGAATSLEPEEEYTFEVVFTPAATVAYALNVTILSNDPDEAEVDVPVEGVGSEDAYFEEVFHQGEGGRPVDILWIVDNSGSMMDEIQRVKDEFQSFLGDFLDMGLDFHLGAVTTDMDMPTEAGRLQGSPVWIDDSTADPIGTFRRTIDTIYDHEGSADEKGLAATQAALTDPLASNENAGFMRTRNDDNELVAIHAIVVSDENDSSSASAASFASWMEGLKSDPDLAAFSAICGDPGTSIFNGGCTEWDGATMYSATAGTKYYDAAQATGGHWSSICTASFTDELQYLSLISQGLAVEFALTYPISNIGLSTVDVNGTPVGYGMPDGWTYSPTTISVTFHGESIPEPSATIRVRYPFDGEC